MLKRRSVKSSGAVLSRKSSKETKFLLCKECDKIGLEVTQDISAVTCGYCVQRLVAPPPQIKPLEPAEKFPRGWALKTTYIHIDGRIFEKGKDTGKVYAPTNPKVKAKVEVVSKPSTTKTTKLIKKKRGRPPKTTRRTK